MAGTKKKSGKKGKSHSQKQPKPAPNAYLEGMQQLPPQERIAAVRPLWETLSPSEREALLTVPLEQLRTYAKASADRSRAQADADAAEALAAGHVEVTLEPFVDETLEVGIARSRERGTWKVWQWTPEEIEFYDSDAFRKRLEESIVPERLRSAIPREPEGSKPVENAAEAALRQRMTDLLNKVQEQRVTSEERVLARRPSGPAAAHRRSGDQHIALRDVHVDLIATMLGALEQEHEALYLHCLLPIAACVCELLPEGSCKSTRAELAYEDFESLLPDDVARVYDWLVEKIDSLTSKLKPEAKELEQDDEDDEPIGDVDLFSMTEDGTALRVNAKWLGHLQSRVLGEDGQPRKAKDEEDPHSMGLVLEWVYGTIVSTAEKARDAAGRMIATKPPDAERAVEAFTSALEEHLKAESRAKASRDLLAELLSSRKEAGELAKEHDIRPRPTAASAFSTGVSSGGAAITEQSGIATVGALESSTAAAMALESQPPGELPDHVIVFMLRREILLTKAKLHFLGLEHLGTQRKLRSFKTQLRQGEPQFERLKRELEELKSAPSRSLDGTYRSNAEMERHRAQLADASLEEQIQVQSSLRETGMKLQKLLELKRECELAMSRSEKEINSLSKWKDSVERLLVQFEAAMNDGSSEPSMRHEVYEEGAVDETTIDEESGSVNDEQRALMAAVRGTAAKPRDVLYHNRKHFHVDVRRQLYSEDDDRRLFDDLKKQLRELEQHIEDGRAALQHLEAFAINVACDDPGITIGTLLVLPFMQERLDARVLQFAAQRAAAAEDEVIQMELEIADRQRAEREKKARAKLKAKERLRSEREKERAEEDAKRRAERERVEEAKRKAAEAEDEARRRRLEELESQRRAEEELIERRRAELLADESSYWRQRAEQEELLAAQAEMQEALVREALLLETATTTTGRTTKQQQGSTAAANHAHQSNRPRPQQHEGHEERDHDGFIAAAGKSRERRAKDGRRSVGSNNNNDQRGPRDSQSKGGGSGSQAASSKREPSRGAHAGDAVQSRANGVKTLIKGAGTTWEQQGAIDSDGARSTARKDSATSDTTTGPTQNQHSHSSETNAAAQASQGQLPSPAATASAACNAAAPAAPTTPPAPHANAMRADKPASFPSMPTSPSSRPAGGSNPATMPPPAAAVLAAPHASANPVPLSAPPAGMPPGGPFMPAVVVQVPAAMAQMQAVTQSHAHLAAMPLPAHGATTAGAAQGRPGAAPPMAQPIIPSANGLAAPIHPAAPPPHPSPMLPALPGHPHMAAAHVRSRPSSRADSTQSQDGAAPPAAGTGGGNVNVSADASAVTSGGLAVAVAVPMPPLTAQTDPGSTPPPAPTHFLQPSGPAGGFAHHPAGMMPPPHMQPVMFYPGHPPQHAGGPPNGAHHHHHLHPPSVPGSTGVMDAAGRIIRPPAHHAFMLPNGQLVHGPPPPPHRHHQHQHHHMMPMGVQSGMAGAGGPQAGMPQMRPLRQLRAAAAPFVPSTLRPSSAATSQSGAVGGAEVQDGDEITHAAADVASSARRDDDNVVEERKGIDSSPRGILEPTEASGSVSGAIMMSQGEDTSSAQSSSEAGSSNTDGAPHVDNHNNNRRVDKQGNEGAHRAHLSDRSGSSDSAAVGQNSVGTTTMTWPPQQQPSGGDTATGAFEPQQQAEMLALVNGFSEQQPEKLQRQQQQDGSCGSVAVTPAASIDVRSLRLTRGLVNAPGLYNCFLNVIVQCLWHLKPVRAAILASRRPIAKRDSATRPRSANTLPFAPSSGIGRVWGALHAVFTALQASSAGVSGNADTAPMAAHPVSVRELREALSSTTAKRFELSDMHDAAEVLGELFERLHAEEAGISAADPTLPRRVRMPASEVVMPGSNGSVPGRASSSQPPSAGSSPPAAGSSVWGNAAALRKVRRAPANADGAAATSLVQRLFGMEVQVPEANASVSARPRGKGSSPSLATLHTSSTTTSSTTVDALHYTKYCHLVPAKGLRSVGTSMPSTFEEALALAVAEPNAPMQPKERLLSRPSAFTLALVWESPQVPLAALKGTLQALREELRLDGLFSTTDDSQALKYALRCMVAYSSSHYFALTLSEEIGQWLLLNDAEISVVGDWKAVQDTLAAKGLQPSLLFYEAMSIDTIT